VGWRDKTRRRLHGVSITAEALRWTSQEGAALYLMNRSEEAFSMIGKAMKADHWRPGAC
jgi:hypothetical protein